MTATLTVNFSDGSSKTIELKKLIEIDTHGVQEIGFRQTKSGEWLMTCTKSFLEGKNLSDHSFLTVSKNTLTAQTTNDKERKNSRPSDSNTEF